MTSESDLETRIRTTLRAVAADTELSNQWPPHSLGQAAPRRLAPLWVAAAAFVAVVVSVGAAVVVLSRPAVVDPAAEPPVSAFGPQSTTTAGAVGAPSTVPPDPHPLLTISWRPAWSNIDWQELVVLSDGTFSGDPEIMSGLLAKRVDDDVLARLHIVARDADLDGTRSELTETGRCRAVTDGDDWAITMTQDGHRHRFSTCEYRLDGTVPAFEAAYEVLASARPDMALGFWLAMNPYPPGFTVAVTIDQTLLDREGALNQAGDELRVTLRATDGVFRAGLAQSPPNGAEDAFGLDSAAYARLVVDGVEQPWILIGANSRAAVMRTIDLALAADGVVDAFSG